MQLSSISKSRDSLRGTTKLTKDVLAECGFQNSTDHDIEVIQYASAMVSHRAAVLVSITTSDIVKRIYEKDLTIAIDGSVYKKHPRMNGWLNRLIKCFNTSGKTVSIQYPSSTTLNRCKKLTYTNIELFLLP